MISASLFVNITVLILLIVFFRKIITRFIESHVSNEPLLFGARYLRATDTDLTITAKILQNPKRSRKITYNLWLKLDNIGDDKGNTDLKTIFQHGKGPTARTTGRANGILYDAKNSKLLFLINNTILSSCSIQVPQQKWFNLNIGLDGTIMDIYIDGELKKSRRLSTVPAILDGNDPITIITKECTNAKKSNPFSGVYGYIDIFRYFNDYIEPDRIKEMYESAAPEYNDNPSDSTFWWK